MAELIKLIIKCMDEKEEFYLEEVKGLTRALLMRLRDGMKKMRRRKRMPFWMMPALP